MLTHDRLSLPSTAEAALLAGSVMVLGVALLMLARIFPVLSTPSKTMVVMLAANLGGAVVSLLQAFYLLAFLARGRYLQQGVCAGWVGWLGQVRSAAAAHVNNTSTLASDCR